MINQGNIHTDRHVKKCGVKEQVCEEQKPKFL